MELISRKYKELQTSIRRKDKPTEKSAKDVNKYFTHKKNI